MAVPPPYNREYSFSDYQANNPSQPLPGPQVDTELENIEAAINGTIGALGDVRRADGALPNEKVTLDSLHPTVRGQIGEGALNARDAAIQAAEDAATARDFAAQWASGPEGVDVDDGLNPPNKSAYHWAMVAEAAAGEASNYAVSLDAAVQAIEGLGYFYDWGFVPDPEGVTTDYGVLA